MRPLRLELEGFASFKQRTVIDFEGADLFVLTGPMGAGKSSIIDAIGFALYGSVARYDRRTVAPIISQGLPQTKVRLDFSVDGQEYVALRVVERTRSGGANTSEARLFRGEELLAGTADEVTERISSAVLGLTFEQFTKCVLLPQGEFADLLHAKAAERQDILIRLLDVTFYRRIGERARQRAAVDGPRAQDLRKRLVDQLADATEADLKQARRQLAALEALAERFDADETRLQEAGAQAQVANNAAADAARRVEDLRAVAVPVAAKQLGERRAVAAGAVDAASAAGAEAGASLDAAAREAAQLPARQTIATVIRGHEEVARLSASIDAEEAALAAATEAAALAAQRLVEARDAADAAREQHDALSRADAAYHASSGLGTGDVCPVCGERLTQAPRVTAPAGLAAAQKAAERARSALNSAQAAAGAADQKRVKLETTLAAYRDQRTKIAELLADQPALAEGQRLLSDIDAKERELAAAREADQAAKQALAAAEAELAAVARAEAGLADEFDRQRNPVAALGAPALKHGALLPSWLALAAWAQDTAAGQERSAAVQRALAAAALRQAEAIRADQRAACAGVGLDLTTAQRPRDAALSARGRAEQALANLEERIEERRRVEADLEKTDRAAKTALTLGSHLSANRFERWYLQEALRRLVRNASSRLQELTSGQYSLDLNDAGSDFVVVDHINANEMRSARSLSGGETFLASLALALALGEDVSELDAGGGARLESLLLDEGFGTLDSDTLEVVASTIEELGARGRMVGLVTHVPELAQRIPVQFRVSKERGSSRVERVEVS